MLQSTIFAAHYKFFKMISRRLARIKTMQHLYAWDRTPKEFDKDIRESLFKSFQDTYQVYLALLQFPIALNDAMEDVIEVEKSKYTPNENKIRANSWLKNNKPAMLLFEKAHDFVSQSPINWRTDEVALNRIMAKIMEEEFVQDYIIFDEPNWDQQLEIIQQVYDYLFAECEEFHEWMEELYGVWTDDEPNLQREVNKAVKSINHSGVKVAPPVAKTQDEVIFSIQLFQETIAHDEELVGLVSEKSSNWDVSRISIIDLTIMKMAMAEFMYFEYIPVKVTINEYLELAKSHSSQSSSKFINGILDPVKKHLIAEGKLNKSGRGLQ